MLWYIWVESKKIEQSSKLFSIATAFSWTTYDSTNIKTRETNVYYAILKENGLG